MLARWARPAEMDRGVGMRREDSDTEDGEDADAKKPFEYVGYAEATGDLEKKGYEAYAGVPLPFPELRRIEIACVDFPIGRDMEVRGERGWRYISHLQYWVLINRSCAPYGFDVPGFVKGLRARVERGAAQVERGDFEQCQCGQRERLRPLVEAVREVYRDGKTLTLDDLGIQEPWLKTSFLDRHNRYAQGLQSDDEA